LAAIVPPESGDDLIDLRRSRASSPICGDNVQSRIVDCDLIQNIMISMIYRYRDAWFFLHFPWGMREIETQERAALYDARLSNGQARRCGSPSRA
jgi:hypothetical protein